MLQKIYRSIRSTYKNIRRTISWLPVIWVDRDFDWGYWVKLSRYKLERLHQFLTSDGTVSVQAPDTIAQLAALIELFKALENQWYETDVPIGENYMATVQANFEQLIDSIMRILQSDLRNWWD